MPQGSSAVRPTNDLYLYLYHFLTHYLHTSINIHTSYNYTHI